MTPTFTPEPVNAAACQSSALVMPTSDPAVGPKASGVSCSGRTSRWTGRRTRAPSSLLSWPIVIAGTRASITPLGAVSTTVPPADSTARRAAAPSSSDALTISTVTSSTSRSRCQMSGRMAGSSIPSSESSTGSGVVEVTGLANVGRHGHERRGDEPADGDHESGPNESGTNESNGMGPLARPARSHDRHAVSRPRRSAKKSRMISARIRR